MNKNFNNNNNNSNNTTIVMSLGVLLTFFYGAWYQTTETVRGERTIMCCMKMNIIEMKKEQVCSETVSHSQTNHTVCMW